MRETTNVGRLGLSEELRAFVEEMPGERTSILAFVSDVAGELPPGAIVLDIGAGDAPYRELFEHCRYTTADWSGSVHEYAGEVDLAAPADDLPLEPASVDAVLLTQVLEHVPDPQAVLSEAARVLRPGGRAFLTVPFVWELHELPNDYWRFTPASLERLLSITGFEQVETAPRTDCFTTLAQLMRNVRWAMGRAPDGNDSERERVAQLLGSLADRLTELQELDVNWTFPLGFTVTARRAG